MNFAPLRSVLREAEQVLAHRARLGVLEGHAARLLGALVALVCVQARLGVGADVVEVRPLGVEAPVRHAGDRAVVGERGRRDRVEVRIRRVGGPRRGPVPERALLELLDLLGRLADAVGDRAQLARQLGREVVALGDVVDGLGAAGDRDHDRADAESSAEAADRDLREGIDLLRAPEHRRRLHEAAGGVDRVEQRLGGDREVAVLGDRGRRAVGAGPDGEGRADRRDRLPRGLGPDQHVLARPQAPGLNRDDPREERQHRSLRVGVGLGVAPARVLRGAVHADDAAVGRGDVGPQHLVVIDRVPDDRLLLAVHRDDVRDGRERGRRARACERCESGHEDDESAGTPSPARALHLLTVDRCRAHCATCIHLGVSIRGVG